MNDMAHLDGGICWLKYESGPYWSPGYENFSCNQSSQSACESQSRLYVRYCESCDDDNWTGYFECTETYVGWRYYDEWCEWFPGTGCEYRGQTSGECYDVDTSGMGCTRAST